jgi:fatty-acyl-CoA synthase
LLFDLTFLPWWRRLRRLHHVRHFVLLCDRDRMPASSGIPDLLCYEDLIAAHSDDYSWPVFDENAAATLCYTSGTTGNPKGVLYSHRSTVLHAYASACPMC